MFGLIVRKSVCVLALGCAVALAQNSQNIPDAPTPKAEPPSNSPFPAGAPPAPLNNHAGENPSDDSASNPDAHPAEGVPAKPQSEPVDATSSRTELFTLSKRVSFVQIPVRVKDGSGRLVEGLSASDFSVYEDGVPQKLNFFNSEPFPLSAAVVLDTSLPASTLKKVNETLPALVGAFSQFDEVALYRYGNTVQQVASFSGAATLSASTLAKVKRTGRNEGPPVLGGPMGPQPTYNGHPVDPGAPRVYTEPKESYVLNDAILRAAQDLSRRESVRRRVIFVISDGREYGSLTSYEEVRKVLLSQNISIYALGVDTASFPVYDKLNRVRLPGFGYGDILPKYVSDTAGEMFAEFSKDSIERAYSRITELARNQYTLGYNTKATASTTYRAIDVHVHRAGLQVFAKGGYYPLPPAQH
jgi:VWFA-related protein